MKKSFVCFFISTKVSNEQRSLRVSKINRKNQVFEHMFQVLRNVLFASIGWFHISFCFEKLAYHSRKSLNLM